MLVTASTIRTICMVMLLPYILSSNYSKDAVSFCEFPISLRKVYFAISVKEEKIFFILDIAFSL